MFLRLHTRIPSSLTVRYSEGACAYGVVHSGGAVEYLVVSDNHTFIISRHDGDIPVEDTPLGLYYDDTRHLSALQVRLDGQPLELLSWNDEHTLIASSCSYR